MTTHVSLRAANRARQAEWDSASQLSLSFKGNEVAGELGEAIEKVLDMLGLSAALFIAGGRASNFVKKLDRERLGLAGSRASRADLAKELADIIICTDLLAMEEGIDLQQAVAEKFNEVSEKLNLKTRMLV